MWTAVHTCERREGVDESGERPEGQPNRLATMTGSRRPRVLPKRQRGEKWRRKERRERQHKQYSENTLHIVLHFPNNANATAATAAVAAAPAAMRLH